MSESEVIVTEMTDEQLDAAISAPEAPAEEAPSAPPEEPQAESPPNTTDVPEPSNEVKEEVAPPEPPPPADEIVNITKSEWEKVQKRIEEKEKFIQRQAQEVGQRRKSEEQLRAEIYALEQRLVEKQYEPLEARAIQKELDAREAQLGQAELSQKLEANRRAVTTYVPEPDAYLTDMAEILREDGQPEDGIRDFMQNPYENHPGLIINLAKRAEARRELRNKDAEIASLKAEVAALKGKPAEVAKKIERALKQPTTMTNDSGQATSVKAPIDASQIPHMTDAEIDQLIKENSA
jgi:chromosome segregation ATPase